MYYLLIFIHVVACLFLILVVLLQAGRGGGVSDMMGGGQPQTLFGTQTNEFMTRATEICAAVFIITSLSLGIISTQRGKSLLAQRRALTAPVAAPQAEAPAEKPVSTTAPGPQEVPAAPAAAAPAPASNPAPAAPAPAAAAAPAGEAR
jgi:preprotein translocase subunit SecG